MVAFAGTRLVRCRGRGSRRAGSHFVDLGRAPAVAARQLSSIRNANAAELGRLNVPTRNRTHQFCACDFQRRVWDFAAPTS